MKTTTKIVLILIVILVAFQLFRITKNVSTERSVNHISAQYNVPAEVESILRTSCYDCHSNNTVYPWYSNIQPVAWWLQDHVNEGKIELNFDEFSSYNQAKQSKKIDHLEEVIKENEMPLSSYIFIHRNAVLSSAQKETLLSWIKTVKQEIEGGNPEIAPSKEEEKGEEGDED